VERDDQQSAEEQKRAREPNEQRAFEEFVYVVGRVNFIGDPSFPPHMKTAELAAAFGVSEATMHAKTRSIENALRIHALDRDGPCPA
jgi:hypothetical protein